MQWREEYNIGIREIDKQHKRLTNTITDLQNALSTSNVSQQIAKTLKFLVDYTQHHFHEEEEIMENSGYPKYENHKKMHKDLINDIRQILLKIKKGESINAAELIDFLISWLKDHIIEEDLKIGIHIKNKQNMGNAIKNPSSESQQQHLLKRLIDLKSMLDKTLISEEDSKKKKSYLILDFLDLQLIETQAALMACHEFFCHLENKSLLSPEESLNFQKQLCKQIRIKDLLNRINNNVEKMELIDFLNQKKLISKEKFNNFKEELLDEI